MMKAENDRDIVAIVTGIATVAVVVTTNRRSNTLIAYRLEQLEKKADKLYKCLQAHTPSRVGTRNRTFAL